jgi:RimJ/RimL family protein N-acetyltransferase
MNKDFKIIEYDPKYKEDINNLHNKILYDAHGFEPKLREESYEIEKFYLGNGNFWLAIDDNKNLIGFVGIQIKNGYGHFRRFNIATEYQGTGLSYALADTVIRWAKDHDLKDIYLGCRDYSTRANAFYKKYGFNSIPESEMPFVHGFDHNFYHAKVDTLLNNIIERNEKFSKT